MLDTVEMIGTAEIFGATATIYLGTREGEFPEKVLARLERIASKDEDTLRELFPEAPLDRVKQLVRSHNVARNYYRLGYELNFTSGFGFDVDGFIDSLLESDDVLIEAVIFKNGADESGDPVYRAGTNRIEEPEKYDWSLYGKFQFEKWRYDCDDLNKRYFAGHRVVFTGSFRKKNPEQVAHAIKVLGGIVQETIDDKTTLVVVGHDPDRSIVDEATDRGIARLSEPFFFDFVHLGDRVGWTYNEFKPGQFPKHAKFIVRELNFTFDGELVSSGRTIAAICKDKDKAQKATQRLKREHRDAYADIDEMKGKRVFDVIELPEEDTMFLAFNGRSNEPRQAAGFAWQGEFLIYAETEDSAHRNAIEDLQAQEENLLNGTMATLSDDPKALGELVAKSKSLTYDEPSQQLAIGEKASSATMIELNRLLKLPLYTIRKSSPIEIMQFEHELVVNIS